MLHLRRCLVPLVVAALVLGACSTKTDSSKGGNTKKTSTKNEGKPVAGGTLNVGLGAETDGWNPTSSQWAGDAYQVGQTVFDPLVVFGADNKPHPYLAESITPSADYKQWTIKVRPGITFHDGDPLNADAVKVLIDKDKASFLVGQAFRPLQSVEKVDDLTVRATMATPWVAFPSALAGQAGMVASPKQLNATGPGSTDHPVGTGPYIFKEWVRDDHFTVTKNPKYWRKDVAYPETITFRVIPDDQTRLSSVQSGQLDIAVISTATQLLQARRDNSLTLHEYDSDPLTMIMYNTAVAPMDDLRVRQGLTYATDQKQLIDTVGRGLAKTATAPYLPSSPWFAESGYPTKPDPTKAKGLIDAYKKDKGISGDLKFTLGCTPTPTNTQGMELLKTQWSKVGVNVDIKYTEQATYITNALNGKYQANCWAQLGATDPDGDSIWWTSTNANPVGQLALNFMRLKDPEIDQALVTGRTNPDPAARKAAYATVWKRFAALLPYTYLAHGHGAVYWSSKVHGADSATLPDGGKPLQYHGALPGHIILSSIWVTH